MNGQSLYKLTNRSIGSCDPKVPEVNPTLKIPWFQQAEAIYYSTFDCIFRFIPSKLPIIQYH